jgi:hypothetical protein
MNDVSNVLERTAPPTTDSDAIRRELRALAHSTRQAARKSSARRLVKIGVPALSVAFVLGGVTSAAASPAVQGWWDDHVAVSLPWLAGPDACVNAIGVESDPQQPADPASLAKAKVILRQIDFAAIQASASYKAAFKREESRSALTHFPADFVKYGSQGEVLDQLIAAKFRAAGIDMTGILISGDETCTSGNQ